jgi:hypothetical protein
MTIFGIAGDPYVVNTGSGTAIAGDILTGKTAWVTGTEVTGSRHPITVGKTGQTAVYATGDNGTWPTGVEPPTPRFTDNGNGTVTDNATGLIWLRNANCFGIDSWSAGITRSNILAAPACSLSDGSTTGQWRLPNIKELQSLIDYSIINPALPAGHPFINVSNGWHWSSTTSAQNSASALYISMNYGITQNAPKNCSSGCAIAWPVRGGQ